MLTFLSRKMEYTSRKVQIKHMGSYNRFYLFFSAAGYRSVILSVRLISSAGAFLYENRSIVSMYATESLTQTAIDSRETSKNVKRKLPIHPNHEEFELRKVRRTSGYYKIVPGKSQDET